MILLICIFSAPPTNVTVRQSKFYCVTTENNLIMFSELKCRDIFQETWRHCSYLHEIFFLRDKECLRPSRKVQSDFFIFYGPVYNNVNAKIAEFRRSMECGSQSRLGKSFFLVFICGILPHIAYLHQSYHSYFFK